MRTGRLRLLTRSVVAATALASLALAGCAPDAPAPTPTRTPSPEPVPTEDTYDRRAAPTAVPPSDSFTFDQAAQYDNDMLIQVNDVASGTATATMSGAEGTAGEIVTVTVELNNEGQASVPLSEWVVQGYYGDADVGAVLIYDEGGTVGDSFDGDIGPAQSVTANFAFAVPASELDRVSILVDPRDDVNGPVVFVGSAE